MQTFLPYADFAKSFACLDYRRLGKQRVEAYQILQALKRPEYGWQNHPATKMWRGFPSGLTLYMNLCIQEWVRRGYRNTMLIQPIEDSYVILPPWVGDERVHSSHRANLLRKDPLFYGAYGWSENASMPYYWPASS